jgi:regulator of CtrA degradation
MNAVATLNPHIVESLYVEALVLSDEVRSQFDAARQAAASAPGTAPDTGQDTAMVEMMCEAQRTNTRVMHCLAWLLNHRAWFSGDITAAQLRRHGRLVRHFPASDPRIIARLPGDIADLVIESERLHARIVRLERTWEADRPAPGGAIQRMQARLAGEFLRSA